MALTTIWAPPEGPMMTIRAPRAPKDGQRQRGNGSDFDQAARPRDLNCAAEARPQKRARHLFPRARLHLYIEVAGDEGWMVPCHIWVGSRRAGGRC